MPKVAPPTFAKLSSKDVVCNVPTVVLNKTKQLNAPENPSINL